MGVREIWVANAQGVRILARTEDGKHAKVNVSRVLPTLSALEIHDWATRSTTVSENVWLSDLRNETSNITILRFGLSWRYIARNLEPPSSGIGLRAGGNKSDASAFIQE